MTDDDSARDYIHLQMIDDELAILLMIYIHLKMIDDDAHVLNPFIDDLV